MSAGRRRRATAAGRSSCPMWSPPAPTARARSARSLTTKRAPAWRQRSLRARVLVPAVDEPTPPGEDRLEQRAEVALPGDLRIQDHVERRRQRHVPRSILQVLGHAIVFAMARLAALIRAHPDAASVATLIL